MVSALAKARKAYKPKLPACFEELASTYMVESESTKGAEYEQIAKHFPESIDLPLMKIGQKEGESHPLKVGVVLSGGQAPGGHNVIAGLFDALKKHHKDSSLMGFLKGPRGILEDKYCELDESIVDEYRNQGGFDMIGSGRDKIESDEDLAKARATCERHNLDGLVVVGGDDSNTNAACIAEYFLANKVETSVVGVPKTIDGDLQNKHVQISFGFDTASKVYAYLISNIQRDAQSSGKYTHFIKLMGRSASHIALECALQTHPNYTLISELIAQEKQSLHSVVHQLADVVQARCNAGKPYGVFLVPEGVIEFIPDMAALIGEINEVGPKIREQLDADQWVETIGAKLSQASTQAWGLLPNEIKAELVMDTDPHGNVQVSHIQTEKLLATIVAEELKRREKTEGKKIHFAPVYHFLGYEGRSTFPTNFDADYCYSLGFVAYLLIKSKGTGRMCALEGLENKAASWVPVGVPITSLMNMELRKGRHKPVIKKALVDLNGKVFEKFTQLAGDWILTDDGQSIGPIQFEGSSDLTEQVPLIVQISASK